MEGASPTPIPNNKIDYTPFAPISYKNTSTLTNYFILNTA